MRSLLAVVLAGCGAAYQPPVSIPLQDPAFDESVDAFIAATASKDPAKVRRFLRDEVVVGGLWFDDVECFRQFPVPSVVKGPKLDALAACLASIAVTRSDRTDQLPDTVALQYQPGIEIEARLVTTDEGPQLAWIGYIARRDLRDGIPTVTPDVLETARTGGAVQPTVDGPAIAHDVADGGTAFAWTKVCVDTSGAVTSTSVREASSPAAARAFTEAMKDWQFKPIMLRGQPTPVCTLVFTLTPTKENPKKVVLPLPLPEDSQPLTIVPPQALGPLVAGSKAIAPDDDTKTLIAKVRVRQIVGAFQYCVGLDGRVYRVTPLRLTGVQAYDKKIIEKMGEWQFKPFLDGDQPARVCSSATFIYTQR
ncbi:MAG TPA: hypothetical protein VL326_24035 [Kofleriaceae bacterium]|nr:hypothetical protein [Kofleriaceae bacterium]